MVPILLLNFEKLFILTFEFQFFFKLFIKKQLWKKNLCMLMCVALMNNSKHIEKKNKQTNLRLGLVKKKSIKENIENWGLCD